MTNNAQNPVTVKGAGADSQNQAGKWYAVVYDRIDLAHLHLYNRCTSHHHSNEIIFIPAGQSIAKHIRKYVREHSIENFPFSRNRSTQWDLRQLDNEFTNKGIEGAVACLVREITLLTPDGQKISGFKPKSIENLFVDYVKPVKYTEQPFDEFDED